MSEKSVSRKSKILSRIPPPRIKRILQTDEEIGKMANPVPAVIARSLEVFIEKLLTKSVDVTQHRLAKTLTPQHIKECVKLEPTFRFLHGVVATVPDLGSEGNSGQSTITSNQGSADSYFAAATGTSTSQRAIGPKRRGSKYVSLGESSTSSQDGPPIKTARRGRKPKLSVELDQDFGDLSDADDDISGEDSGDKTYHRKSSTKTVPKQQRRRAKEEVYELGPTASDDVPDDPSTS